MPCSHTSCSATEQLNFHAHFHDRLRGLLAGDHTLQLPRTFVDAPRSPPAHRTVSWTESNTSANDGDSLSRKCLQDLEAASLRGNQDPASSGTYIKVVTTDEEDPSGVVATLRRLERISAATDMSPAEVQALLEEVEATLTHANHVREGPPPATGVGRASPSPSSQVGSVQCTSEALGVSPASPSVVECVRVHEEPVGGAPLAKHIEVSPVQSSPQHPVLEKPLLHPSALSMRWYYHWMHYYQQLYAAQPPPESSQLQPLNTHSKERRKQSRHCARHRHRDSHERTQSQLPSQASTAHRRREDAERSAGICSDARRACVSPHSHTAPRLEGEGDKYDDLLEALHDLRNEYNSLAHEVAQLRGSDRFSGGQQSSVGRHLEVGGGLTYRRALARTAQRVPKDSSTKERERRSTASSGASFPTSAPQTASSSSIYSRQREEMQRMRPSWRH